MVNSVDPSDSALAKAAIRAADMVGIDDLLLATVIGLPDNVVANIRHDKLSISFEDDSRERSILFIRLASALDAITGGDRPTARSWLTSHNSALGDLPGSLIQSPRGLSKVAAYLDCRNAKF